MKKTWILLSTSICFTLVACTDNDEIQYEAKASDLGGVIDIFLQLTFPFTSIRYPT